MRMGIGIMRSSDIHEQARKVIETVTAQLDQGLTNSLFDEPIDKVARQFGHKASCPVPQETFHEIIAGFLVQIYDEALNAHWKLSNDPLGEAMGLLETHYQSSYGRGYVAALLDANDAAEGGVDTVLRQLAEIIKDVERYKYTQSVFAVNVDPTNWHLQCKIVEVLLRDYEPILPEFLLQCRPWELVSQIPSIVSMCLCSDSALQEILSCSDWSAAAETLFTA